MVPIEALLAGAEEHRQAAGRPLVTLSYAQSLDGSIAALPGSQLRLSGPESMALTHRLRAAHDAILVGIGTLVSDDPRLNVRLVPGRDPQPVVLDSHLRIPMEARLLHGACPPWIATLPDADPQKQVQLEGRGARVIKLPPGEDGRVSLPALLECLGESGINRLMVEGGAGVLTAFLRQKLADRLVLTIAPVLVGGLRAVGQISDLPNAQEASIGQVRNLPNAREASVGQVRNLPNAQEAGVEQFRNLPYIKDVGYERLGDDLIVWGRISNQWMVDSGQ